MQYFNFREIKYVYVLQQFNSVCMNKFAAIVWVRYRNKFLEHVTQIKMIVLLPFRWRSLSAG